MGWTCGWNGEMWNVPILNFGWEISGKTTNKWEDTIRVEFGETRYED